MTEDEFGWVEVAPGMWSPGVTAAKEIGNHLAIHGPRIRQELQAAADSIKETK